MNPERSSGSKMGPSTPSDCNPVQDEERTMKASAAANKKRQQNCKCA